MKLSTVLTTFVMAIFLAVSCQSPTSSSSSPTPKSTNADLSNLAVSSGTLSPAFAAATTAYSVGVANSVTTITVTGTAADTNATVSANSGVAQSLNVGPNTITIAVTAQDGTVKNYVVSVDRAGDYSSTNIGLLKYVAGGTFTLQNGGPNMTESTFRMSQNLITRAEFSAVMGADPSNTSVSTGTSDPVQNVNWYMAIAFCNKLSIQEGLTPVYTVSTVSDWSGLAFSSIPTADDTNWDAATMTTGANGYRLPTEMQDMWAMMGGMSDGLAGDINASVNTLGYLKGYAGSTEASGGQTNIGNYAWYNSNSGTKTHPVGTKTVNELGIYDLSGNVFEWCWDWSASYPATAQTDYMGGASGTYRINRGGSFGNDASYCTVANRSLNVPYGQSGIDGFRVVRP